MMWDKKHGIYAFLALGFMMSSIIESRKTPPMQMAHPMALRPEIDSLKTMAEPTMTTTRLAVLATD